MTFKLNVHTDQQAFDKVRAHLATMTRQSVNPTGTCLYAGPNKARCAISALIKATHRDVAELDIIHLSGIGYLINGGHVDPGNVSKELLISLQAVHDDCENWTKDGFRDMALFEVARTHGLKYQPRVTVKAE